MERNFQFVGSDKPQKFFVEIKDPVARIATLKVAIDGPETYLTLDMETHRVVGRPTPQVLQLSSEENVKYTIHPKDVNEVAFLPNSDPWSPILVGPAPEYGDAQNWIFERLDRD
ncbi:hypothetical protein BDR07DRAFT_1411406 [Suillus spraguei]|nr:hypothetical protein BDR07DRAFT_1436360 [Suillus spraguei]KAG2357120.1 hypothetical protein BDR07DRAFT_1421298 [Suillus spraguei]KAG2360888.1 hypothetical protein BDR07DRAFT_1411406 [Suillus spraguei]